MCFQSKHKYLVSLGMSPETQPNTVHQVKQLNSKWMFLFVIKIFFVTVFFESLSFSNE